MIVQLTGTLVSVSPSRVVLDVGGVGYEMGVSSSTAAALPETGSSGVTLLTRLVMRDGSASLYGFLRNEERVLFDKLCQVSGVGPRLALAVLSTFQAPDLARIALAGDAKRMAEVPGVGKKLAGRLVLELASAFEADVELQGVAGMAPAAGAEEPAVAEEGVAAEVTAALLQMGFTSQEAELALDGMDDDTAADASAALAFALRRLGGGR